MYKQNNYVEIELLCASCGTIITGRVKPIKKPQCFSCRKKYLKENSKKQRKKKQVEKEKIIIKFVKSKEKVKEKIEIPKKTKKQLKEIHQKMWLSRMFT